MLSIRAPYDCLINMKFSNNVLNSTQNQKVTSNIVNKFKSNSEQKARNVQFCPSLQSKTKRLKQEKTFCK